MAKRKTHEEFIEEIRILNPNIEILEIYVNANTKIKCRCLIDENEWYVTPAHLLNGGGCPVCAKRRVDASHKKKTHEEYVAECKIKNPNLEIIGKYVGIHDKIECRCKICGGIFSRRASKNIEGQGCPICANVLVVQGINDIATTHPHLIKYFSDKNDAYKYTYGSNKKIFFKCPFCGTEKMMKISHITDCRFPCEKCGDGVSYPNKFGRFFLEQLPIENVCYEWTPEWVKDCDVLYRYDNYFEYQDKKYILEMDGGFHYQKFYHSNLPLEETKRRDREKDILAQKHNIKVIRIDCRVSTKEYIINSIVNSELSKIFNLNDIDWDYCDKNSCKSLLIEVCEYYNKNNNPTTISMGKIFHITPSTISSYLKKRNKIWDMQI